MESGQLRWLNAGDLGYRRQLNENFNRIEKRLEAFCQRNKIGFLSVDTSQDYIPVLEGYFKRRGRQRK